MGNCWSSSMPASRANGSRLSRSSAASSPVKCSLFEDTLSIARSCHDARVTSPETCIAFVLGGGGHLGAVEVGMLQALLDEEHTARPGPWHVGRRHQRMPRRTGPIAGGCPAAHRALAGHRPRRRLRRIRLRAHQHPGPHRHRAALTRRAEEAAGTHPVRAADRGPRRAFPVRGSKHRECQRALVHLGPADRRRPRLSGRARAAAAVRDRRGTLPRRRDRQQHPRRPRRRARSHRRVRAPGRPRRTAAVAANPALGGRAGGIRDRTPASFRG